MAIATDRLHTIVTLDAGNYQANANRVVAATAKMKAAGVGDGAMLNKIGSFAASAMPALGIAAQAVGAGILAATVAIGGLSVASLQAYGNLERLTLGLQAVEGSADIAGERLKELRELAKAPGLGFEQAVGAYGQLRNAGASTGFAQSLIREIANANARGGGGATEFGNVMRQIAQTLNRPFLQGEELNSFREAQLPVDRVLRGRFGTSDTEELKRLGISSTMVLTAIVEEFSKMERVAGGFNNALENLQDGAKSAIAEIGKGIAPSVMSVVDTIGNAFGELTDSGVLKRFGDTLGQIGNEVGAAFKAAGGGMSLSEALIEFGAAVVDVAAILGGISKFIAPVARLVPGLSAIVSTLDALSGGAGADFREQALASMRFSGSQAGSGPGVGEEIASLASQPNPVQERQLNAQEQIARNTAELVRFEQQALGGGNLLAMGINAADANRFNGDGRTGGTTRAKSMLIDAVEAMIATQLARATR